MNVSLTPRLEELIREKVQSRMYNNASEVVREALRLLDERDRERRLREALAMASLRSIVARQCDGLPSCLNRSNENRRPQPPREDR